MRRIADLHPSQGKADARDAHVIAEAACSTPHKLRRVGTGDETLVELSVLAGYDDDLAGQSTRLSNRLRDALLHVHPALERYSGSALTAAVSRTCWRPHPPRLRLARTLRTQNLRRLPPNTGRRGTAAFARVISGVVAQLRDVRTERGDLAAELEACLEAHPLGSVLISMPGLGVRTAIKILTIVGDGSAFPAAGHLAACAGLAPVTRRSGTSIKGETRLQRGDHALESALFLSAFASLADPVSRAYYDRKRPKANDTTPL